MTPLRFFVVDALTGDWNSILSRLVFVLRHCFLFFPECFHASFMFRVNRITWEVAFHVDACRGSVLGLQQPWMVEASVLFHSRHFCSLVRRTR